ncbi:cytochrome c [Geotalea uraniireducens]|uniref:Cytochrome c n=1 Tax=Geotalea uraniireducens TaxID=351604 RepID=A0ABN6VR32_9BACT|nr:cytochrome C [Geotalea uraniireducens]BDV42813.1 cytochrome c [Geotalea uraniireducens]
MRFKPVLVTAALVVFGTAGFSYAFHSGGVAECEGCHTMHNSLGGQAMGAGTQYNANAYLLQGTDQSSTCLNCHAHADTAPSSYHIMTYPTPGAGLPPVELTPGGDFAWLKKDYSWVPRTGAATETSPGERHGHNVVAADFGYVVDSTLTTAPGGSYPADKLSCISCHDPHGKYRVLSDGTQATTGKPIKSSGSYGAVGDSNFAVGTYRLLAGTGYTPVSVGGFAFTQPALYAAVPSSYNRSEATSDTRVAYGKGTSEWCANCHVNMHSTLGSGFVHPAGQNLGTTIINNYNAYVKSGDMTGTSTTAFTSMVPFQSDQLTDNSALFALTSKTDGPSGSDKVSCLSCHRAHATGWDSMTRWNNSYEMLVLGDSTGQPVYPGTDSTVSNAAAAQGRTVAEVQKTFYDRPATKYAAFQRSLCNKCHAKD